MTQDIRISVALVTRNRPESLRRCLTSLRAQDVQPWEVVISDDSDDHESALALAKEFGVRHVLGPKRGLYGNRNSSALACEGTHIRTMDDDHTFPPGHFSRFLEALATDRNALWTCGEASFLDGKPYDAMDFATQLHPTGVGCPVENSADNWAIADGSTVYPREVFDQGFRFVEEFGFGSAYLEFGALLYARGWKSRCVRGARVEHHQEMTTLTRHAWPSILYASLCYNLRFRPNRIRALRHAVSCLMRQPLLVMAVPRMFAVMRQRWDT